MPPPRPRTLAHALCAYAPCKLTQTRLIMRYPVWGAEPFGQRKKSSGTGTTSRALPSLACTDVNAVNPGVQETGCAGRMAALKLPFGESPKYHSKSLFHATSTTRSLPTTTAVKVAVVRSLLGHGGALQGRQQAAAGLGSDQQVARCRGNRQEAGSAYTRLDFLIPVVLTKTGGFSGGRAGAGTRRV